MKIRQDFVTNSSNSSYIIALNEPLPEKFKDSFEKYDVKDLKTFLEDDDIKYNYFDNNYLYENFSEKKLKELGKFTDEQLLIIKLFVADKLEKMEETQAMIDEHPNREIYSIYADRDWMYRVGLYDYIERQDIISYEGDL